MVLIGASAVMFVRVGIATAVLIGILLEPCGVDALYNLVQSGLSMSKSVVVAKTALASCNSLIPAATPAARTTRAANSVVSSTSTRLAAT